MVQYVKGQVPKQAHVDIPAGLYEEEHGRGGFYGPVSHVYHKNPPTGWTRIEGPLRPHAVDTKKLPPVQALNPLSDRVTVLYNEDVNVQICRPKHSHPWLFRNADGDELYFVHQGQGVLETDYGTISYEKGDYLVIPRGTTYRMNVEEGTPQFFIIFESKSPITQPERGILGQHALYDQTVIGTPELTPCQQKPPQGIEWEVKVKRLNHLTSIFYPFNPCDIAGWKGDLTPWKLNVRDICPVLSHKVHLPPSVHSTFQAQGFVICSFLPRPLESEPGAMRVPFYHRNIDYDEVLFYHDGDFFSRDGIHPGMITFHPQGIHHGPHPKAIEKSWTKTDTDEIAVMLDTLNPLHLTPEAQEAEWKDYWKSWQEQPASVN